MVYAVSLADDVEFVTFGKALKGRFTGRAIGEQPYPVVKLILARVTPHHGAVEMLDELLVIVIVSLKLVAEEEEVCGSFGSVVAVNEVVVPCIDLYTGCTPVEGDGVEPFGEVVNAVVAGAAGNGAVAALPCALAGNGDLVLTNN